MDVSANSLSLWFQHRSRPFLKMIAMDARISSVKKSESLESVASLWNWAMTTIGGTIQEKTK